MSAPAKKGRGPSRKIRRVNQPSSRRRTVEYAPAIVSYCPPAAAGAVQSGLRKQHARPLAHSSPCSRNATDKVNGRFYALSHKGNVKALISFIGMIR